MKWQNIRQFRCPYDNEALVRRRDGSIKCTVCYFHIESKRFNEIMEHRASPQKNGITRLKWQYLREGKCPACAHDLISGNGPYEISKCVSADCTFHIREDRMQEILQDPNHPANRFPLENLQRHEQFI